MSHSPVIDKASLRIQFRTYRSTLDAATYARLSNTICDRARALPELNQARTVHIYWPLISRNEVDSRPLIRHLQASGKRIVLPVVHTFSPPTGKPRMDHRLFTEAAALTMNHWGLEEPVTGESVPLGSIDAVVVPALGAGRNGHRIGHGRGYYDEFLSGIAVPTICLVYDSCLVDFVPSEKHDVPMDIIITEREALRMTGRP